MNLPRKVRVRYSVCAIVIAAPVALCVFIRCVLPTYCMDAFLNNDVPEEYITDPLVIGGSLVTHRLIEEVQHRSMKRRDYAIQFLGQMQCREAKGVLITIASDSTESDHTRKSAIAALYTIDPSEARALSSSFGSGNVTSVTDSRREEEIARSYCQAIKTVILYALDRK